MIGSFDALPADEPYPGLQRRVFDSAGATVTEYRFEPGASFPLHRHPQEQITLIADGEVEMTIDGSASQLRAGDWSVVGPEVDVVRCAARLLERGERVLEPVRVDRVDHLGEHLDQPPVGVVGEARVAGARREALGRLVVQAEVEDRVHHPGHRDGRARPH